MFAFSICLSSVCVFAQEENLKTQKAIWRTRAETITDNLLKETTKISELERALLFAKLGDVWWEADASQSNYYFEKSVDTVFFYSDEDIKNGEKEYFNKTRNILSLINKRNEKQAGRLIKILSASGKASDSEREFNSDALIEHALRIVKENPNRAAQVGLVALRTGEPKEFYRLIWELRRSNKLLADQLFEEAFSHAKKTRSYSALAGIQLAVLPESQIDNFPTNLSASPRQKIEVLNFFADYIIQLQANLNAKVISDCRAEAFFVQRMKSFFETLLPQKAGLVQQAVNICAGEKKQTAFEDVVKLEETQSVEQLLKLADESEDNSLIKIGYLTKAVILASNQKNYALVIKIVNSLSKDELEKDRSFWEQMRAEAAGKLAFIIYKENDYQGALKTLKDIPESYRVLAQIIFVQQLSSEDDDSNFNLQIETLNEARDGFVKSEMPFEEKSYYWFQLIKFFSMRQLQTDASDTFREIVISFNDSFSKKENRQIRIEPDKILETFSPIVIEAQENSIFETVKLINDTNSRIDVNLALLKISLQKYKSLNSASTEGNSKKL